MSEEPKDMKSIIDEVLGLSQLPPAKAVELAFPSG